MNELYILDAFSSWTSEENAQKIHKTGKKLIVKIGENMTPFLQLLDRIFFGKYKGLAKERHKEFLKKQATAINAGTRTKFVPQTRHDILQNTVSVLTQMQIEYYTNVQKEWKRIPIFAAYNNSENYMIHHDLSGAPNRRKHYKHNISKPKTAAERLNMKLPRGRREYLVGSKTIYLKEHDDCTNDVMNTNDNIAESFMVKVRQTVTAELGSKTEWTGYPQTATSIKQNCPIEWLSGAVPFIASATSFYKGHGKRKVRIPSNLPTLQSLSIPINPDTLPLSKTVTTTNQISKMEKEKQKHERNLMLIQNKEYHLATVKYLKQEITRRNKNNING
eukprot:116022_1